MLLMKYFFFYINMFTSWGISVTLNDVGLSLLTEHWQQGNWQLFFVQVSLAEVNIRRQKNANVRRKNIIKENCSNVILIFYSIWCEYSVCVCISMSHLSETKKEWSDGYSMFTFIATRQPISFYYLLIRTWRIHRYRI
jgi:hypothetical protein